jgi:hypothetical protein
VREGVGQIRGQGQNSRIILKSDFSEGDGHAFKLMQFIDIKRKNHTEELHLAGRSRQARFSRISEIVRVEWSKVVASNQISPIQQPRGEECPACRLPGVG